MDFAETTIIRREITPAGKSRAFINDTPVLLDTLKLVGEQLLDIHSQHDTLLLSKNDFQLKLIDTAANNYDLFKAYQSQYKVFKKADREFNALSEQAALLRKEHEFNLFQLEELDQLKLNSLNQIQLEEEQGILEHAEEIKLHLNEASELIDGTDFSIHSSMAQLKASLNKISGYSDRLKSYFEYQNLQINLTLKLCCLWVLNLLLQSSRIEKKPAPIVLPYI